MNHMPVRCVFTSVSNLLHRDILFSSFTGFALSCPIHSHTDHYARNCLSPKALWHIDC